MAIKDMQGTVATTTGIMNNKPTELKVPDMSNIKMPKGMANTKPVQVAQKPVEEPADSLTQKIQNLTNEDKAVLSTVLSPSVSNVLSKVAPELNPLLDAAPANEENMIIPVSVAKDFATRKYGGGDEQTAMGNFIAELQGSTPGMNNMMDNQSVPPDTQMAEEDPMIQQEIDDIDSGLA